MQLEHALLAVHEDEKLGLCQRQHKLQFFLAGVARDVYVRHTHVYALRAVLVQLVYHPAHAYLVAA